MMIFIKGHYLPAMRSGQKTATIRAWRTCTLQPGAPLLFNGRLRAHVTRVVVCRLSTLTLADIAASGFTTRVAFRRAWRSHYPASLRDAPCVVLHFALD